MQFPEFFDRVPRLRVRDPLAAFLGAAEGGVMEYGYADAVRLAGHSCPTVASAYRITGLAMERLYRATIPERGGIRIEFRQAREEGVTGVVAAVATLLTGASGEEGFHGLGGRFGRRGLLSFGRPVPMDFRFVRQDNGAWVDCAVDLRHVPADPALPLLIQKCLRGEAEADDHRLFGELWQDRVRRLLLDHWDDGRVFVVA